MCGNQRYWLPWKLLWIWFLMWFIRNIIIPPNTWMCLVDSWSIVWLNFDKWVKYLSNFNETIDQPSKWVKYLHLHVKPSHFREETGPLQSWQFSKELIFTLIILCWHWEWENVIKTNILMPSEKKSANTIKKKEIHVQQFKSKDAVCLI